MISFITGTITSINTNCLQVMYHGLGFEIFCPHAQSLALQETITLHTYMHWNQEQGPSLYGFLELLDKELFLLIISCSGIGPKMGLSILEQVDATLFIQYISEENITQLSKLKSIGAKKAEQLCLNLRNKVSKLVKAHPTLATKDSIAVWGDLQETLTSLNYSSSEIKQTTSHLKEEFANSSTTFDQLLRKALQILAKK